MKEGDSFPAGRFFLTFFLTGDTLNLPNYTITIKKLYIIIK